MEDKKIKKIIVNSLTGLRVLATALTPILFNAIPASLFLLFIVTILLTDSIDGILARKWDVSTLGGSLLDMSADKIFGFSVLIALSSIFPIMTIPIALETLIASINISGINKNTIGKSSEIGRIKTWIMGISIFSLLLVGLSPELLDNLKNIKIDETLINSGNIISSNIENIKAHVKELLEQSLNFINSNKKVIENVCETATITSEGIVATDYTIKALKKANPDSKTIKIADLIKNKKFILDIIFDEKYYKKVSKNEDMSLLEKLVPNKYYDELKEEIKKLQLK